jgi:uncharacterized protein
MSFASAPGTAAWQHQGARAGFEVVYFQASGGGCHIEGWTTAFEDGDIAPHLDGCLDVDLESSAMTNALPVHRMSLRVAARADVPTAYVRAVGLAVERLEQTRVRTPGETAGQRYDYSAPAFDFRLVYDESGLLLDYPGIAVRAG